MKRRPAEGQLDLLDRAADLARRWGPPARQPEPELATEPEPEPEPPAGAEAAAGRPSAPIPLTVIRSANRKRSVSARLVNGVIELRIPSWMSKAEEARWIDEMRGRFARKRVSDEIDLSARCGELARRYDLPTPSSVRWVTNQQGRWGSCTPGDATIRISDRLAGMPLWVLDYVLVHELCHLRHPNHSPAFWKMVNRYPKTERARGYLLAVGLGEGDGSGDADDAEG